MKKRHVFYIVAGISIGLGAVLTAVLSFTGMFNHYTENIDVVSAILFGIFFSVAFFLVFSVTMSSKFVSGVVQ